MSTLADDLLNDFADSGSEDEGEQQNGLLQDEASPPANGIVNGHSRKSTSIDQDGGMELDDDEEEVEDEDEEMMNADTLKVDDIQDEEEAKAKVEKMQLGAVNDVRSVAGLMKTLEPVLEVGLTPFPLQDVLREAQGLHLLCGHSPDVLRRRVENSTLPVSAARQANHYRWFNRRQSRISSSYTIEHSLHLHR